MVTTDLPAALAGVTIESFQYAGDDAYPSAGENSAGFVRVADPAQFTAELLRSDASPWPIGMLATDANSVTLNMGNSTGGAITYSGFIFAVTVNTKHGDYENFVDSCGLPSK